MHEANNVLRRELNAQGRPKFVDAERTRDERQR
jgi:hypothetical protein